MTNPIVDVIKSKIGQVKIIRSMADFEKEFRWSSILALDIETYGRNKLPGDCAATPHHGVHGVSLANAVGDAVYVVMKSPNETNGVDIVDFCRCFSSKALLCLETLVLHNSKFDLGFLEARGLNLPGGVRIIDTWALATIRNEGVYKSSKLKELVRDRFGVDTSTKTQIDEWLEAHGTRDFGEIPNEILAPYACDDVRYTLMLLFSDAALNVTEREYHDMYIELVRALNRGETRGIRVNVAAIQEAMKNVLELKAQSAETLKTLLGATQVDFTDEQVFLKYMHSQNLHPEPQERFGELVYVFDEDFMRMNARHPLIHAYNIYHAAAMFIKNYSPAQGAVADRVLQHPDGTVVLYPSMYTTLHAGGTIQMKIPDYQQSVKLNAEARALFQPRVGCKFVTLRCVELMPSLLAYYSKDLTLSTALLEGRTASSVVAERTGYMPNVAAVLLRTALEGSGNARLAQRLQAEAVPLSNKQHLRMKDKFYEAFPMSKSFQAAVNSALESEGFIRDIVKRKIRVPEDKRYRSHAILLASSAGGYMMRYIVWLSRLAATCEATMLLAHRDELLFEVSETSDFITCARDLLQREDLGVPRFRWAIAEGDKWETFAQYA